MLRERDVTRVQAGLPEQGDREESAALSQEQVGPQVQAAPPERGESEGLGASSRGRAELQG